MEEQKKLVTENISYLKDLGVTNYQDIFLKFYEMFLMDNSNFIAIFSKYEKEDLIEKLKKKGKFGKRKADRDTIPTPAPTTKKCPYCFTEININATRCPHCTSELTEEKQMQEN